MEIKEIQEALKITPRIIIVDDDKAFRNTVRAIIKKQENYEVEAVGSAQEALDEIKNKIYHLAIVDLRLEGEEDGLKLAEELKEINPYIGVILVTGYANLDVAMESMKKGVEVLLTKPADPVQIILNTAQVVTKQKLLLEREKFVKDLKEANEKLKEMDELKTRFISMVSHELKTPLTTILGYGDWLEKKDISSDDKIKSAISSIRREGKHLQRLIDDLLDVTRIEAEKFKIDKSMVKIDEIIKTSLDETEFKFKQKGVELNTQISDREKEINVDYHRIAQTITILLNNACEHTNKGGKVDLNVRLEEDKLKVKVVDTGEGIEKDKIPYLFDHFYQEVRTDGKKIQGLGLGLAIAKEIVEKHGGEISAQSEGKGKGSKFYFNVPSK